MEAGTLLQSARVYSRGAVLPAGWVLVRAGRIAALGPGDPPAGAARVQETIDLAGRALAPGLIDLHAHGALGHDTMDADPEALRSMARFYATHGVTGFLAATMTAPLEQVEAALCTVALVTAEGTGGAALLGAHLEGPYLDAAHPGAQDPQHVIPARVDDYELLFGTGVVRLVTLAPEVPENRTLIPWARERGALVAMGHTGASYEDVCAAANLGLGHVTHLFNGMDPMHHRHPGAVGAALMLDSLSCELIADLVHVHPVMLALAAKLKGTERVTLVTDAMAGTGMPDGQYMLGGLPVTVAGGVARGSDGILAGSTLTMERAVANMARAMDAPLEAVLPMATRVPARLLGLPRGDIAIGQDADLIVLESDGSVSLTMVAGEIVWRR